MYIYIYIYICIYRLASHNLSRPLAAKRRMPPRPLTLHPKPVFADSILRDGFGLVSLRVAWFPSSA